MGLGFVLMFWAAAGTVVASLGAATFGCAAALLTRGVANGRRKVIIAASLFPFECLIWAGVVFVFQAVINEGLLHRDVGLGDTWHAPLPNGYEIMMIDVTDQGWVYNPKTQPSDSGVTEGEDAVSEVRTIQIAGPYILGGVDSKAFEHLGTESNNVDLYFLLDTRTGNRTQFGNFEALRAGALKSNIEADLQPINAVYAKYRFSWFDVFAGLLFCVPVVLGATVLTRGILRLRRTRFSPGLSPAS